MSATVRTKLVRIGNSRGIRIPRTVVEQAGLQEDLELEVQGKKLIVRPAARPRDGWEARFRSMADAGADGSLWPDAPMSSFDEKEWVW